MPWVMGTIEAMWIKELMQIHTWFLLASSKYVSNTTTTKEEGVGGPKVKEGGKGLLRRGRRRCHLHRKKG